MEHRVQMEQPVQLVLPVQIEHLDKHLELQVQVVRLDQVEQMAHLEQLEIGTQLHLQHQIQSELEQKHLLLILD